MKVGWNFDRGKTPVGEIVPVKCRFTIADENGHGTSTVEFIISEEAAQEMLVALAQVANPPSDLVVAHTIPEHPEKP